MLWVFLVNISCFAFHSCWTLHYTFTMLLHIFAAFDHHCQRCQQVKPKRVRPQVELRPLTQDELLAEAARTELDNLRDLEQMVALEEATRKKAMYKRSKYSGPMIRFHSKRVEEVALVSLCTCNRPCVHNLKLTLKHVLFAARSKPSFLLRFC